MKIAYIADARSPIAQSWISYFIEKGHDVHILSSYPYPPGTLPGAKLYPVPIAFSGLYPLKQAVANGLRERRSTTSMRLDSLQSRVLSGLHLFMLKWLAPLEIHRHIQRAHNLIARISPDIVHAMRIPFEGILAAKATPGKFPLLVSVWGNDFTLFANSNPLISYQTQNTLRRANALLCDCKRDLNLAYARQFSSSKLAEVLPGTGGIETKVFYPDPSDRMIRAELHIPDDAPIVINPRGFRAYVRNDMFFQSIPLVLQERPETVFICSAMQGNPVAEAWIARFGIARNVRLLPMVPHSQMADLFRMAEITVSPSTHDGTPNTLLEAMACGCFPVAGDIESVREWITHGSNGFLCDPARPQALARAILKALQDEQLRHKAREHNLRLIQDYADRNKVMPYVEEFYHKIIQGRLGLFSRHREQ